MILHTPHVIMIESRPMVGIVWLMCTPFIQLWWYGSKSIITRAFWPYYLTATINEWFEWFSHTRKQETYGPWCSWQKLVLLHNTCSTCSYHLYFYDEVKYSYTVFYSWSIQLELHTFKYQDNLLHEWWSWIWPWPLRHSKIRHLTWFHASKAGIECHISTLGFLNIT